MRLYFMVCFVLCWWWPEVLPMPTSTTDAPAEVPSQQPQILGRNLTDIGAFVSKSLLPNLAVPGGSFFGGKGGTQALSALSQPISRLATGFEPLPSDIEDIVNAVPDVVKAHQNFDLDNMTPALLRHLLNGGRIPGVEEAALNDLIAAYMRRMADAATVANAGGFVDANHLPPLKVLPPAFLKNVVNGYLLPGLDGPRTSAIRRHYMTRLGATIPLPPVAQAYDADALLPGQLAGIPPVELINRMPTAWDMARVPPAMLADMVAGRPITITTLPDDMLASFRAHNPDLEAEIEAAIQRRPPQPTTTQRPTTTTVIVKHPKYDISAVDRQADLRFVDLDAERRTAMYTGIGLGCVLLAAAVSFAAWWVWRRRHAQDNMSSNADTKQWMPRATLPRQTVTALTLPTHQPSPSANTAPTSPTAVLPAGDSLTYERFAHSIQRSASNGEGFAELRQNVSPSFPVHR